MFFQVHLPYFPENPTPNIIPAGDRLCQQTDIRPMPPYWIVFIPNRRSGRVGCRIIAASWVGCAAVSHYPIRELHTTMWLRRHSAAFWSVRNSLSIGTTPRKHWKRRLEIILTFIIRSVLTGSWKYRPRPIWTEIRQFLPTVSMKTEYKIRLLSEEQLVLSQMALQLQPLALKKTRNTTNYWLPPVVRKSSQNDRQRRQRIFLRRTSGRDFPYKPKTVQV